MKSHSSDAVTRIANCVFTRGLPTPNSQSNFCAAPIRNILPKETSSVFLCGTDPTRAQCLFQDPVRYIHDNVHVQCITFTFCTLCVHACVYMYVCVCVCVCVCVLTSYNAPYLGLLACHGQPYHPCLRRDC